MYHLFWFLKYSKLRKNAFSVHWGISFLYQLRNIGEKISRFVFGKFVKTCCELDNSPSSNEDKSTISQRTCHQLGVAMCAGCGLLASYETKACNSQVLIFQTSVFGSSKIRQIPLEACFVVYLYTYDYRKFLEKYAFW